MSNLKKLLHGGTVSRNALVYYGNQIYLRIAQFVIITILARSISEWEYGIYGLIIVLYRFMPLPISLGFNRAIGRVYLDDEGHSASNSVLLLILFMGLLVGGLLFLATHIYSFGFDNYLIWSSFVLVFLATFTEYFLSIQKIREKAKLIARAQVIGITIQLALVYAFTFYDFGIATLIWIIIAAELVMIFLLMYDKPIKYQVVFDKSLIKENLGFALPFIIYGGSIWIFQLVDRWMIEFYLSLREAAWYTLAFQLGNLVTWLSQPINQALSPRFDKGFVEGGMNALQRIHQKTFSLYTLLSIVFFFGVVVFGWLYLKFVVPSYYNHSINCFILICFGGIFRVIYLPFINVIKALKETKKVAVLSTILILGNFILNLIFIPFFGIVGAALTTLVSHFSLLVLYYIIVLKKGIRTSFKLPLDFVK